MWAAYLQLATEHPLAMAFAQFALFGTAGEVLSAKIRQRAAGFAMAAPKLALKALGWGLLGIYIKAMFVTAAAGVHALVLYGALPTAMAEPGLLSAAATSVLLNTMLGPSMVLLHRGLDNAIDRLLGQPPLGWMGIGKGLATLVWLWIPLHTLTFLQPKEVRIGVAALLSMVLGVVLGWSARPRGQAVAGVGG